MKVERLANQFDSPTSSAVPATPSCCCCCCCCLATLISAPIVLGSGLSTAASVNSKSSAGPILVGLVSIPLGIAATVAMPETWLIGALVTISALFVAFRIAGEELGTAVAKSLGYSFGLGTMFAIELAIAVALIFTAAPAYLLVVPLGIWLAVSVSDRLKARTLQRGPANGQAPPPPNYFLSPPPPTEVPGQPDGSWTSTPSFRNPIPPPSAPTPGPPEWGSQR